EDAKLFPQTSAIDDSNAPGYLAHFLCHHPSNTRRSRNSKTWRRRAAQRQSTACSPDHRRNTRPLRSRSAAVRSILPLAETDGDPGLWRIVARSPAGYRQADRTNSGLRETQRYRASRCVFDIDPARHLLGNASVFDRRQNHDCSYVRPLLTPEFLDCHDGDRLSRRRRLLERVSRLRTRVAERGELAVVAAGRG